MQNGGDRNEREKDAFGLGERKKHRSEQQRAHRHAKVRNHTEKMKHPEHADPHRYDDEPTDRRLPSVHRLIKEHIVKGKRQKKCPHRPPLDTLAVVFTVRLKKTLPDRQGLFADDPLSHDAKHRHRRWKQQRRHAQRHADERDGRLDGERTK